MGVKKKMNTIRWQPCQKTKKEEKAWEKKLHKIIFLKNPFPTEEFSPTFEVNGPNYSKNVNICIQALKAYYADSQN